MIELARSVRAKWWIVGSECK